MNSCGLYVVFQFGFMMVHVFRSRPLFLYKCFLYTLEFLSIVNILYSHFIVPKTIGQGVA